MAGCGDARHTAALALAQQEQIFLIHHIQRFDVPDHSAQIIPLGKDGHLQHGAAAFAALAAAVEIEAIRREAAHGQTRSDGLFAELKAGAKAGAADHRGQGTGLAFGQQQLAVQGVLAGLDR